MHRSNPSLLAVQVRKRFGKCFRSSNACLVLLPCPHLLLEWFCDLLSSLRLLLLLGGGEDVETNPGPCDTVREEQLKVIAKDIQEIKNEKMVTNQKLAAIDKKSLAMEVTKLRSGCDDAENRQRRDNLLFFGINDEDKEDWATSEEKIITFCSQKLGIPLTNDHFERVHRLGKYKTDKQRPIIAKMSSFKNKQKVLSAAHKLKGTDFSIGEDFSPSTRYCRKKLIEFAKRLKKPITLSVDKLRIDDKTYMYDHATDSVILHKT
nr:uncharacterized protein LOC119159791 [Rhipicephalus microplus]